MIEPGKLLAGRYRLIEQIDAGGTAYIYRAKDERDEQIVAVKILKPEHTKNDEFIQRFKKEVQASLKLRHANLVRAYDAGMDEGLYYIVMELIDGQTLKQLIGTQGPLPVKYVVGVAKKLCLALEYAHVKGFVHRDIKPHNVMIDKNGEPFITDFGIARDVTQNSITTEENSVMGSVHYFSPEQARGERVDKRSDLYSLGILMYEMMTGEVPFDADASVAIALKHINEPLPDISERSADAPESLKKIIYKASQKDKHFRYKTAFGMYEDLQRCLAEPDGEYIKYTESKRTQQHLDEQHAQKRKRNVKMLFALIGICAAAVLILVFVVGAIINSQSQKAQVMPLLKGMSEDNAREVLEDYSVILQNTVFEFSEEPEGTVIAQKPEYEAELTQGTEVELTVSKGMPESVDKMPNVTGVSLNEATEALLASGLEITEVYEEVEGEEKIGFVMEQSPAAGTQLAPGEAIYLTVKIAPDDIKIKMPRILNMNMEQAVSELQTAGFKQFFVQLERTEAIAGTVLAQSPEESTEYAENKPVIMTVEEYDYPIYYYSGTLKLEIADNNTHIRIGVRDTLSDGQTETTIYYLIYDAVMEAGYAEVPIEIALPVNSEEDEVSRQLSIFVNDNVQDYYERTLKRG
ncbi:MAG: protein kinase domain-containing protein [Christensenellaceae bacterium]|jgi:serine/threonine protein kinase